VVAIVNNKEPVKGGRMNFIVNGNKILHTIINIPSDGVYLGVCIHTYIYIYIYIIFFIYSFLYHFTFLSFTQFSSLKSSFTVSVISLRKLRVPPSCIVDNKKQCVGYDFKGNFTHRSLNIRDENGEEIPNIEEYFANINNR
jgi:hypothetical protein